MLGRSGIRFTSILIGVVFILVLILTANRFSTTLKQKIKTTQTGNNSLVQVQEKIVPVPEVEDITDKTLNPDVVSIPETGVNSYHTIILIAFIFTGLLLRKKSQQGNLR